MSIKASLNNLSLVLVNVHTLGPTITFLDNELLPCFLALKGNLRKTFLKIKTKYSFQNLLYFMTSVLWGEKKGVGREKDRKKKGKENKAIQWRVNVLCLNSLLEMAD